jgi:hypothetical protein
MSAQSDDERAFPGKVRSALFPCSEAHVRLKNEPSAAELGNIDPDEMEALTSLDSRAIICILV